MEGIKNKERELFLLQQKCWRKRGRWVSLKAAHRRARQIYKLTGIRLYPYRCSGCGMVHLTKQVSAKGKVL